MLQWNLFRFKGKITLECSRCLESLIFPVDVKINRTYDKHSEEIDVGDEIRQSLILNMPSKPLCKQDCAGLCSKCGKNLNTGSCNCSFEYTDPRWEKLKNIMKSKK